MAEPNKIPTRPYNDSEFSKISAEDKALMSYVVAFQVPKTVAFGRWYPEFLTPKGKLNSAGTQACYQFFQYNRNREYMDAYQETLDKFLMASKSSVSAHDEVDDDSAGETRKARAVSKLVSDCLIAIESNASIDPETLKDFVAMAKALGVLKEEESKVEASRRYLPLRCMSECQYRFFVEENLKNGNIESDCKYCKALEFAKQNGYLYDPTHNLNYPATDEVTDSEDSVN